MHLLIGDEAALPAIARRLEELPATAQKLVLIDALESSRAYPLAQGPHTEIHWLSQRAADHDPSRAESIIAALRRLSLDSDGCYAWAALESNAARAVRRYLLDECLFDKRWIKAAGYWQKDSVAVHEVIRDDE
jgi:NADPH-dependent ferric siderophore reductase